MFEQFQAQQKKAKDEERKKKTEAMQTLASYRKTDLSEEEVKLAAIREQERQRKAEAAALLQKYRKAGLSEEEAKKAALRQEEIRRKQQMEEQLRINGVVTVAPDPSVHSSLQQMEKSGAVSAMTAQFSVGEVGDSPAPATTTIAAASPADLEEAETWATAATPITQETIAEPETTPATTTEISASIKSSVNFVFGLIMAASEEPITEGYLKTAHQITKNVLTAAATTYDTSMILSSLSYPKVRSITKDNAPADDVASQFNKAVLSEIRSAIAAGTFTRD